MSKSAGVTAALPLYHFSSALASTLLTRLAHSLASGVTAAHSRMFSTVGATGLCLIVTEELAISLGQPLAVAIAYNVVVWSTA